MRYFKNLLEKFYFCISRSQKKCILFFCDAIILTLACYFAFFVRLEFFVALYSFFINWQIVLFLIACQMILLFVFGIYRSILSYSFHIVIVKIFQAISLSIPILLSFILVYRNFYEVTFPRLILFFEYFAALFLLSAWRFLIVNLVVFIKQHKEQSNGEIIIFGAGAAGAKFLQLVAEKEKIAIFIDDKKELQQQTIGGIKIVSLENSKAILNSRNIRKVVIAIPSLNKQRLTEIFQFFSPYTVSIQTVDNIIDTFGAQAVEARNITIEDLIGRVEIQPKQEILQRSIQEKIILITGAGGSIGTALCQIIIQYKPKLLILLDNSEIALYKVENLLTDLGFVDYKSYLCDILAENRIKEIFACYPIDTVYHTAAYKHVNIIEQNPAEGVSVNVFGTWNIVQHFIQSEAKNFVLISTDKAVFPISIMGQSKRVAEIAVRYFAKLEKNKIFTIVRFGNVINSSGSVIPRFKKLIQNKKDLVVTHKEATRYFMSLLEAASLVIQAGEISNTNEIFHLDMGYPVKIYTLAYNLIRLYGYRPNQDIKIKIGKLHAGEKIHEADLIDAKNSQKTEHPKIFKIQEGQIPGEILDEYFLKLRYFLKRNELERALMIMQDILAQGNKHQDLIL